MKRKKRLIIILTLAFIFLSFNLQASWTTKRITWNSGGSYIPAIVVDSNNNLYIFWHDNTPGNYEVYYKKSTDGGSSWTTKRLTWNSGTSIWVAATKDSNDNIYVAWRDNTPGNIEIYLKKSTDGGSSWTTKRLTWNSGESSSPDIATDTNNNIYLVWDDNTPGNAEIYLKKSTDGGSSWSTQRLTWNSGRSYFQNIAVDSNNNIYVVWKDDTLGNYEVFLKKSTDGGSSWSTQRLTWNSGDSGSPDVTTDPLFNDIHIVWHDYTSGNAEVYYKKSTDGGSSWSTERLTWNSGSSWHPDITTYIDWIWIGYWLPIVKTAVVWDDNTPGNGEIYFKHN